MDEQEKQKGVSAFQHLLQFLHANLEKFPDLQQFAAWKDSRLQVEVGSATQQYDAARFLISSERSFPGELLSHIYQGVTHFLAPLSQQPIQIYFRSEEAVSLRKFMEDYWTYLLPTMEPQLNSLARLLQQVGYEVDDEQNLVRLRFPNELGIQQFEKKQSSVLLQQVIDQWANLRPKFALELAAQEDWLESWQEEREEEEKRQIEALMQQRVEENEETEEKTAPLMIGYPITGDPIPIEQIQEEAPNLIMQGMVFDQEIRTLKTGRLLLMFNLTDFTDSIQVKMFSRNKEDATLMERITNHMWVRVKGHAQDDSFSRELTVLAQDIQEITKAEPQDEAVEKRVEFHAHTQMSAMDAVVSTADLVKQAKKWGHEAIAITDHAVLQAFPEAYLTAKKLGGIKIIYGVEANLINDSVDIVMNPQPRSLSEDIYVVFDVETTGLSVVKNRIIELAGVKMKEGQVIDRFETFINPHQTIPDNIQQLTSITNEMVADAPELSTVIRDFALFVGDATLVAHNARFDMGFIQAAAKEVGIESFNQPVLDTLQLARLLFPDLKNHKLNTLTDKFNVKLENHHRAVDDSEATGYVLYALLKAAIDERHVTQLDQLNQLVGLDLKNTRPFHCNIYALNKKGLKNLYKLISMSHIQYFHRVPLIPRSQLQALREGLLVISGCDDGELFETVLNKSVEEAEGVAHFYDVLEIQPPANYLHLVDKGLVQSVHHLEQAMATICSIGEKLGKPVIATGNVHYLRPVDKIYRDILIHGITGFSPLKKQRKPDVHFKTTTEMLNDFQFLGEEKAYETVVTNTRQLAQRFEEIQIIPDDLYTPRIEGSEEEIREMSYAHAKAMYGDPLPEIVEKRLEKELHSIISNGFSVIYLIAQKLVKKSIDDGYLVGSRGSVGSSFVATMTGITEVNPLPPHYICPQCQHSIWFTKGEYGSGFDLPDQDCPQCGTRMKGEGHDIPFETFLGFKGDKVPDIDLNFSGDYQPQAHNYTKVLFGEDYVYRAGTIGTVAEKTAYGYVKKYEEEYGKHYRKAEVARLASGCAGAKRSTGQHPGGIIVVPDYMDIHDFCPIQYPADDLNSEWRTTHYDFHSIHDNVLKLDILGHDDPTVIRMLQDLTGIDPKTIPVHDEKVISIFSSTEALGVTPEQIRSNVGTLGLPEFGTRFVRQMLEDTNPSTFAELVQISGLSHGTDVWLNNAQDLVRSGIPLKQLVCCRDDIMIYLISRGLEPSLAFKIMEAVRKGRGLQPEWIDEMKVHDVPDWYVGSCQKIKYMFPKAHATAYVLMAFRIAYFKVYYPIYYYATYFSVRADEFDVPLVRLGSSAIRKRIEEIEQKGNEASPKEKGLLTALEVALEMCERGFSFSNIDLYRSDATRFIVDGNALIPPFNVLPGIGTNVAINLANAAKEGEFLSKEDLQQRSRASKAVVELLDQFGCLEGLPDSNQLSLF
ncbi:PolC-type DNA polymerase III [Rubeoparvulum massiliense]|uniref:PolC-type DNA polymerase III n=1 Tax=Rubeoparvulum massiliense TaxID=1631346 RepID=UPI00069D2D33|nr:PolC-type DNA polymerase III [Rubeoparvulum massiliense]